MNQHTINLPGGYVSRDPKDGGAAHKSVTFGRRPTLADVLRIDGDAQSAIEIQSALLHVRAAVTSFEGVRRNPVPLSVLLQLDGSDREALFEGFTDFMRESLGERASESLSDTELKLAFGLEVGGETYDVLEFSTEPKPLTGYDEVGLERQYGAGLRKEVALIAREVVRLSQSEGEGSLDAELTPEALDGLDAHDFVSIREFAADRRARFRRARKALQRSAAQ